MLAASPADAQLFDRRYREAPPPSAFNPFRQLFEPFVPRQSRERAAPQQPRTAAPPVDHSRAPPPVRRETEPTSNVVVMGASLADWLAFGLEDIYADRPEIGVLRKNHPGSGLIRFDARDGRTWAQVAQEFLADRNPDVIVMLIGLEDRQPIRERAAAGERPQPEGERKDPRPDEKRPAAPALEFRTEAWAEAYGRRIDETIAALKSKGVPVVWVGLPPIRGSRSTADVTFLNDQFRAAAERAGIVYVDAWEGFVDEAGRFATFGPDVDGQVRRLRTAEGVFFTRAGARKLAHYVEREVTQLIGARLPAVALPSPDSPSQPAAGPVIPLSAWRNANDLVGGDRPPGPDNPLAARVLVDGAAMAPPEGRADNFFWSPEAAEAARAAAVAAGVMPTPAALLTVAPPAPDPPRTSPDAAKKAGSTSQTMPARGPGPPRPIRPREGRTTEQPAPPPPRSFFDPFGLFR